MRLSWISPSVRQRRSKINGAGLFALKNIKKGDIVLVQGGEIVHYSEIYKNRKTLVDICFQVDQEHFISPIKIKGKSFRDGAFLMNHSCDANCGIRGQITFIAMKNIKKGEELTYDYALTDYKINGPHYFYEPMMCNCHSKDCRHVIRDTDCKNPAIRKKYAGYFSKYIQKLILR